MKASTGFYNSNGFPITFNCFHTLYALKLVNSIGLRMAKAYLIKRNVPVYLLRIAIQLRAAEKIITKELAI